MKKFRSLVISSIFALSLMFNAGLGIEGTLSLQNLKSGIHTSNINVYASVKKPVKKAVKKVQKKELTVYVTRTGAKYHSAGCRYLNRSCIPTTLTLAKSSYTPCSVCNPPQ